MKAVDHNSIEVVLPKVDMDMESGVIAEWKVAEGDSVREGDILFEMETNKSVMEVEAPASGTIRALAAITGDALPVGTRVAWIDSESGAASPARVEQAAAAPVETEIARDIEAPIKAGNARGTEAQRKLVDRYAGQQATATAGHDTDLRATPFARRTARLRAVDLALIAGSGPRGRIEAHDVAAYADHAVRDNTALAPNTSKREPSIPVTTHAAGAHSGDRLVPFSPIRRLIAQRLSESTRTAPHFYLTTQVEMTALLDAVKTVSAEITTAAGVKPSVTLLLAYLTGRVLMDHPLINASIEGEAARLHAGAHIGIAMDCEGDLLVPVLRDVQSRTLVDLARELKRLRDAVHSRSIAPADMRGGTFTISNLGMYGVDAFTAIINPPESAILAIGRSTETPVGRDGKIVLRAMATLSLSSDHRMVDGITAARFMADLRQAIEDPPPLLRTAR